MRSPLVALLRTLVTLTPSVCSSLGPGHLLNTSVPYQQVALECRQFETQEVLLSGPDSAFSWHDGSLQLCHAAHAGTDR